MKYDFETQDNRIRDILLVRLNFVETWSAKRTLAYFQSVRRNVEFFYAAFWPDENSYRHHFDNIDAWKISFDRFGKTVVDAYYDHKALTWYKNALKKILDKKENIKGKNKPHKRAYLIR